MDDGRQPSSAKHVSHDSGVQANHQANEYVRYKDEVCISTNTIEGYFPIAKRGINGVYHQVGKRHQHRYLAELDSGYNTRKEKDGGRTLTALDQVEGKRLNVANLKKRALKSKAATMGRS
jgi:hypothetical protein